jgi:hypothetical protein
MLEYCQFPFLLYLDPHLGETNQCRSRGPSFLCNILLYFLFLIIPAAQFRNLNWRPSHQVSSSPRRPAFSPLDLIRPAIDLLTAASGGRFDATLAACMAVSADLVERVKELGGDNPGLGAQQRSQLRKYWRRLRDVSAHSGYLDEKL